MTGRRISYEIEGDQLDALLAAKRRLVDLEAEIARARQVWEPHGRHMVGHGAGWGHDAVCPPCRIAAVFGWNAP